MKIFQKIALAGEDVQTLTRSGRFYKDNAPAAIHDGAIVAVGDPVEHDAFAPIMDLNIRKLTAPAAATDVVAIVDYVGISKANVMGVKYLVGDKVVGTYPDAGENTRIRVPMLFDEFWLGDENFNAAPTVGKFATVTANDTILTVGDSKTAGQFCVKIVDTKPLTEGMVDTGVLYRCIVVGVPA